MAKDRKLSPEERVLWGKVARSTHPLPDKKGAMQALDAFLVEVETEIIPERQRASSAAEEGSQAMPTGQKQPAGQHHPFERPVKRKLAKGRLALEARIDLHGLIQSEAHAILLEFLVRAHERGLRHVLVITGKGSSMGSEGALKRAVPLWFAKPEFRFLISSYETAAHHHGGEGALYIRLSRQRGARL